VELAYVRDEGIEPDAAGARKQECNRPVLRAVPDLTPSARPELPQRRPSRRAVVRARVWGVPLSAADVDGGSSEWAPVDERIAEAVRLLGAL
jgi:hypothetical protein